MPSLEKRLAGGSLPLHTCPAVLLGKSVWTDNFNLQRQDSRCFIIASAKKNATQEWHFFSSTAQKNQG
jgi:hypothetical protein